MKRYSGIAGNADIYISEPNRLKTVRRVCIPKAISNCFLPIIKIKDIDYRRVPQKGTLPFF